MLYATAGSRLYIADAPAFQAGAYPTVGWIEIGDTEALGMLGVQWSMAEDAVVDHDFIRGKFIHAKGAMRRAAMQLILGQNPADPGQAVLWSALHSHEDSYPFRLVLPDGVTVRQWFALVIGVTEVFDTSNSVIKLQADLQPTSHIHRSEEG